MCKLPRISYYWIPTRAALIAALGCSGCNDSSRAHTTPPAGLLPASLDDVRLGITVEELYKLAPATVFAPYEGLYLEINNDVSGFKRASFYTGNLYPERPPTVGTRVEEIHLEGEAVDSTVVTRIDRAAAGAKHIRRCAQSIASEIVIWEPPPPMTGIELILSRRPPRRARLRFFSGPWRETPVTAVSIKGRCSSG
jgi:hypothetical protein